MGIWIEIKEKAICPDYLCVARVVLESILERAGLNVQIDEKHVKKLGKLISEEKYDSYAFMVEHLKISIYDIGFDIIECHLDEGCEGYITASVLLEGDSVTMREIAKKIAKDMGIDKYL